VAQTTLMDVNNFTVLMDEASVSCCSGVNLVIFFVGSLIHFLSVSFSTFMCVCVDVLQLGIFLSIGTESNLFFFCEN